MKYNNATFGPDTNIKQGDVNSLDANFKLAEWEWSNVEQTESLLSFWTPYEVATEYNTEQTLKAALATPRAYHEGIIYSGLAVDGGGDYLTVDIGGEKSLAVKPGSIIYTIDLAREITDSERYLIIESPVKYGYNYTIVNGLLTFSGGVLNTGTRPIKGPTGASNGSRAFTFSNLNQLQYKRDSNQLKFAIPLIDIPNFTYTNAFSISFYSGTPSYENEVSIPHSAGVNYEENAISHSYTYYLYIEFDVTAGSAGDSHFISEGPNSDPYNLLIW